MWQDLDEISQEILQKYRPALQGMGVDFSRLDIQTTIINCSANLEPALQRTIEYWLYLTINQQKIFDPNAILIAAIKDNWQPHNWQEKYLQYPQLKSPCLVWWEEAGKAWGEAERDKLIADVYENKSGEKYILLQSNQKINLKIAKMKGLDWVKNYAQTENLFNKK